MHKRIWRKSNMNINLRPYQNEARYQCNTLINAKRHPCLVLDTGGGKTKTGCVIIEDQINLGEKIFVLTPQEEIFEQWVTELVNLQPGTITDKGIKGIKRNIYVCMPLSLVNILNYLPESFAPDIIITDEAHHSAADSWEKIYDFFPKAIRFGLTATPRRTDGKGLDHLYTDIVQTTNMKQLIKERNLTKPITIVPEEYLDKVPIKDGDYDPQVQAQLLGEAKVIGDVIERYSIIFGGLPVLVACATYEHAKMMKKAFNDAGWKWDHIHSNKLAKSERKRMLREIRENKLNGLCTVGIGTEGLDIPGLYGLIWLRRTISLTIFKQFNGRALRPMPGKECGIILDCVGNTFIHGLPERIIKWSLKGVEQKEDDGIPKMRKCPHCGVMNNKQNIKCHFCGLLLSDKSEFKDRIPAMVDGNLISVTRDEIPELKKRSKIVIEKQKEKDEEKESCIELTDIEKTSILRKNLFKNKRKILSETIGNFL
jgi:superfamily II DNA or RNA helicase